MASVWLHPARSLKFRGGICWHLKWREGIRTRGKTLKTGNRAKAEKCLAQKRSELESSEVVTVRRAANMGPLEALRRYIVSVQIAHPEKRTADYYRDLLRPFFTAHAGTPLAAWTRGMLEGYIAGKPDWSRNTARKLVSACKTFIDWAQDCRILPEGRTFVGRLKIPSEPRREHSILTQAQVRGLMAAARARPRLAYLELPIALAAFAGLSESDWAALDWAQVDLDRGVIAGRRTKTDVRFVVAITPVLDEALRRHRATSGPVCRRLPRTRGAPRQSLRALQRDAGIPDAVKGQNGWKRFRHSYMTWLADAGVPAHARRLAAGHSPGSHMQDIYTHPDDERSLAAQRRALG